MNTATLDFIKQHATDDVRTLALQSAKYPEVDMGLAIRQIAGRQKIRLKVPAFFHCDQVLYPVQLSLEQSSSEITALYKSEHCQGETLIDLTGGMGVDCYFMSKHFKSTTYVEQQQELVEIARHNFMVLQQPSIETVQEDSISFLDRIEQVDWIFIDPARRSHSGKKVFLLSDCEPDLSTFGALILSKAHHLMVKLSPMMDITAVVQDLQGVNEVHIVAVDNECKEVLLVLEHSSNPLKIKTINFSKGNRQCFDFEQTDEYSSDLLLASDLGRYLYEPNVAILKSGAFKLVCHRYSVRKLHQHTHLYTSDTLIDDFPGRIFDIVNCWGNSKTEWKAAAAAISKANVSIRNFPISVEEFRKKFKINDGGDTYLFACTTANGHKTIIQTRKVVL